MRIKELSLKNFKRFTDLQIKNIPAEAKLVLLIGANGSGKSSIFDAFEWMRRSGRFQNTRIDLNTQYFKKDIKQNITCSLKTANSKSFSWKGEESKGKSLPLDFFYGRPSLRIVPTIENVRYDENVIRFNTDAPNRFIEFDDKFNLDVSKYTNDINKAIREPVFAGRQADIIQIFRNTILPFNEALERIFGKDPATTIRLVQFEDASPDKPTKLLFQKGNSEVNYDLLGHGEKQVVVILLNFVIRRPYFQDTVYYIDEMDGHLNTTLQYALLKEITENWIPENCQLWTASHSLGFIEYAKDTDHSAILDFDNLDFDETQTLEPIAKQYDEIFEIAIPRVSLAKILGNRKVVLCENKNYELYSLMGLDDFIFTDVLNSNSVFLKIKRDKTLFGLRDRDFLTDKEIHELTNKFSNYKILRYYCFENYLYHPENVTQLNLGNFDKAVYENEIRTIKNDKRHEVVVKINGVHKGYEEFKAGGIKEDNDIGQISKCLESDDFETFYPFFSFKDHCGSLIHKYKIDKKEAIEKLVQTNWFVNKLKEVLK
jgi:AAA domain, putative AbiEii toxin, Type IV TA system